MDFTQLETRRVLIIGDNGDIQSAVGYIRKFNYELVFKDGWYEAQDYMAVHGLPHVVVVFYEQDKGIQNFTNRKAESPSGLEVCMTIRETCELPIMLITPEDLPLTNEALKVANACMTYPVDPEEFVLRLYRMLERIIDFSWAKGEKIELYNGVEFYPAVGVVVVDGEEELLTPTETVILQTLVQFRGQYVPKEKLVRLIWKDDVGNKSLFRVHIFNIRRKLRDTDFTIICSNARLGYMLTEPEGNVWGL